MKSWRFGMAATRPEAPETLSRGQLILKELFADLSRKAQKHGTADQICCCCPVFASTGNSGKRQTRRRHPAVVRAAVI